MEIVFIVITIAIIAILIHIFVLVCVYSYDLVRREVIYRKVCKKTKKAKL